VPPNQQVLDGEPLLNAITKHVLLVMLHISWPKLTYQIADAIVEVTVGQDGKSSKEKKKEIEAEFRSQPQWQLMPMEWRKKLVNLEGRARSLLAHASIQFATRGIAVLPMSRAQEVFSGLRALRTEMEQNRDEFVTAYESILEELASRLGAELFKKVQGKLPEAETVAGKFGIVWAIVPAGGRSAITDVELEILDNGLSAGMGLWQQADLMTTDGIGGGHASPPGRQALQRAQQTLQQLRERARGNTEQVTDSEAGELIAEAQAQMHQFTREMLENMAREPREILTAAADNLLGALQSPQRIIRNGTISQVREAFEMVEGFEFLAGPELLNAIRQCRERLYAATPQQLNGDAEIGAQLAAGLSAVREAAADSQLAANAVRRFRGIRIREKPSKEDA